MIDFEKNNSKFMKKIITLYKQTKVNSFYYIEIRWNSDLKWLF